MKHKKWCNREAMWTFWKDTVYWFLSLPCNLQEIYR